MDSVLHEMVKQFIEQNMVLPFRFLEDKKIRAMIEESGKYAVPSNGQMVRTMEYLQVSPDNLLLSTNLLFPYVYHEDLIYVEMMNLDQHTLEFYRIKETIAERRQQIPQLLAEGDYDKILVLAEKRFALSVFHDLYEEIPLDKKYEVFKELYVRMEYGFDLIDRNILEDVLELNPDKSFKRKLKSDSDGFITVFRGEGSRSTPYRDAYSWTTNQKVANFFANRFDTNGMVYQGKVHIDDVIDYIDDRNEQEILIHPEAVLDVTKIDS
ncbi:hypothetical protein PP175_25875 (plasmid) [Aneurinibacillus sp. Ricciae_BoGa-3]|uniref:hypothetical protein n=1 Tax=Aneurinibacillus sp. Ricciae_BoGa-3 TaxID=3022697 RepID=UPI002341ACA6|nr:hypothetical protein [Aneurinibacillus sp. Ricciae_BoGa-3]WCK57498.1 hypothetical protein PP175_25875 [Aneurinibacillus sp. Ricciae_BoGa-3]